jgi:uncharacterized protein YndB with AHSA1/START domain
MTLKAQATIQIQKPIKEVFEAIVNPAMMTNYFISESTGRMEDGAILNWKFPEFPEMDCPVKQIKTEPNKSVSFVWDPETVVHILLTEQADKSVVVTVEETGKNNDEAGLKWLVQNTEGWANFLACMKAWLEYGVQLRKGAFDFMKQ